IIIDGKEIRDMRRHTLRSKFGMVLQDTWIKEATVLDNILLPAIESEKGGSKKEKLARAEELMRKLGIIGIADNDINEVSGGQLQRACICRSMMNSPKILFADEPTGALNRQSSIEVMDELCKLNDEGTTIMMVTHDAKVAARCSRVLYILDGRIKGEFKNDKNKSQEERERTLNNWLLDLGW
ncbi:MAG: ATP-binding cassette domain-containing protein, partial [Erysipelotrichaceae bacterium]|nr:ATP-binding cassette domain-containing protein [Erysipelotrichaceae bacterium]